MPDAPRTLIAADAIAELMAIVGADHVRTGEAVAQLDYGWSADNLRAGVVVSPASTAETAAVVRVCGVRGLAIVPHGGRTGLVGGGVSSSGQVVVALQRMTEITRLDRQARVAVVGAGLTLEALQAAAATQGLEPGIDLAARGSATIGGMVSTNAGGVMAFRNGVMRHRVLGLEAVLPDGAIFDDLTTVVKNTAGYDLKHLFIGAEGTLGLVTRVALKLDPLPKATATAMLGLSSVGSALEMVHHALASGKGQLRAAEVLWRDYLDLTATSSGWNDAALDRSLPLYLLLVLGGDDEAQLQEELQRLFAVATTIDVSVSGLIATSRRQEQELMHLREFTEAIYRRHGVAPSFDVSVPQAEIDRYLTRALAGLQQLDPSLAPYVFGHLADGNLHIVLNCGPLDAVKQRAVEDVLYDGLRASGGSFSAEHGIGSKRIGALEATADPTKLALMKSVKRTLDPRGLMNPGKVLASLD